MLAYLVLGLLIGWLIEWVIDWFYWRRAMPLNAGTPASAPVKTEPLKYSSRPPHADDLTAIRGVGPVIARRLNQSGIYTYQQISELTLDEFEDALGDLLQRFINERAIIRHAGELAAEKKKAHSS